MLRVTIGRGDAIEKDGERVGVGVLGKVPEPVRWNVANRVSWAAAEERRSAVNRKTTSAGEASPLVLMRRAVCTIPLGELAVAVSLPRVTEECSVNALRTTQGAGIG